MDKFTIQGNTKLTGQIKVSGSKNSALPIIISSLLTDEKCVIKNVPNLHDISSTIDILQYLGKKVEFKNNTITITKNGCCKTDIPYELVKKMRASFLSAGPLLARYKHATISLPGGCAIGIRPVDIHLKGFSKLGAKIKQKGGDILISAKKLKPAKIILGFPSVGASQNLLMCASLVEGKTILENIAREPEVDDLINCLNGMGAKISYQANKVIVEGVKKLSGINHTVIADRIETGTYLIAAACTKSTIEVINCEPENDEILIEYLQEAGFNVKCGKNSIKISPRTKNVKPVHIKTAPYPGFATDLQPLWMVLMSQAKGTCEVSEDIFENRFMHVAELVRMGANIHMEGKTASIMGGTSFTGANVMSSDLRGGACLVLAGLCASGETVVDRVYHIDRGYEQLEKKLAGLGATIKRKKA